MFPSLTTSTQKKHRTTEPDPVFDFKWAIRPSGTILTMIIGLLATPLLGVATSMPSDEYLPIGMLFVLHLGICNLFAAKLPSYVCSKYLDMKKDKIEEEASSYSHFDALQRVFQQAAATFFSTSQRSLAICAHFAGILAVSAVTALLFAQSWSPVTKNGNFYLLAIPAIWCLISNCGVAVFLCNKCEKIAQEANLQIKSQGMSPNQAVLTG